VNDGKTFQQIKMEIGTKTWENKEGVDFLQRIGIKPGQKVLDFGSRYGDYAIPAAKIVGDKGLIYAVDKNNGALLKLEEKIKETNLSNIKVIKTNGEFDFPIEANSIDVVLLYDVLHYLDKEKRNELYHLVYELLKPNALLSVYPKHITDDFPWDHFKNMTLDNVKEEIENGGFSFQKRYCGNILHDEYINQGCVLNFRK